jgi:hypothetical protein
MAIAFKSCVNYTLEVLQMQCWFLCGWSNSTPSSACVAHMAASARCHAALAIIAGDGEAAAAVLAVDGVGIGDPEPQMPPRLDKPDRLGVEREDDGPDEPQVGKLKRSRGDRPPGVREEAAAEGKAKSPFIRPYLECDVLHEFERGGAERENDRAKLITIIPLASIDLSHKLSRIQCRFKKRVLSKQQKENDSNLFLANCLR